MQPSKTQQDQRVSADEHGLIAACLHGDAGAFAILVRRHQDRLFSTVYRLVGNVEDARDIVQESFLNAYQSLRSFKGDALFSTWLHRIAVNAAISNKRKRRLTAVRIETGRDSEQTLEPVDQSEASDPGHGLERAEQERRIRDALARLSAEHRAVLVMKDMEGQKYEAIAAVLRVPIGTVRSRLHRARFELRELLERDEA
jgi:RNA polymerase sigma-70 factor (ECF subfamily)